MKKYIVKYTGNATKYKNFAETTEANNAREAVINIYSKFLDDDYYPQEDGTILNGAGNEIADQESSLIEYDGGCFFAVLEHFEKANESIDRLNRLYGEDIFSIKHSNEDETVIENDIYRYEGNDVYICFDQDGITGTVTGITEKFSDIDNLIENIDRLFINE